MAEISNTQKPADQASLILNMAQKVHDETITRANEEAKNILEAAKRESERLLKEANEIHENAESEAKKRADEVVTEAQSEVDKIHADSETKTLELEERIQKLVEFESTYRESLTETLKTLSSNLGFNLINPLEEEEFDSDAEDSNELSTNSEDSSNS